MSITEPTATDHATYNWYDDQAYAELMARPLQLGDGGSDLRFIDTVLADMIVFARLNLLEELGEDLATARAKFQAQVELSQSMQSLAGSRLAR